MKLNKFLCYWISVFLIFICNLVYAETLSGNVVKVIDGDTIKIIADDTKYTIRFACIDAPESKQEFGIVSKQALYNLINDQYVTVEIINTDMYGRKVGLVSCQGLDVNGYMLKNGYAWHYRQYDKTDKYSLYNGYEQYAKDNMLGLWQEGNPIEPWLWRKRNK